MDTAILDGMKVYNFARKHWGPGWTYPRRGAADQGRRQEQVEDDNPERRPGRSLRVVFFGLPGSEDYAEPSLGGSVEFGGHTPDP